MGTRSSRFSMARHRRRCDKSTVAEREYYRKSGHWKWRRLEAYRVGVKRRRDDGQSEYCPQCSFELENRSCKLVCSRCGYFMSCSDY